MICIQLPPFCSTTSLLYLGKQFSSTVSSQQTDDASLLCCIYCYYRRAQLGHQGWSLIPGWKVEGGQLEVVMQEECIYITTGPKLPAKLTSRVISSMSKLTQKWLKCTWNKFNWFTDELMLAICSCNTSQGIHQYKAQNIMRGSLSPWFMGQYCVQIITCCLQLVEECFGYILSGSSVLTILPRYSPQYAPSICLHPKTLSLSPRPRVLCGVQCAV